MTVDDLENSECCIIQNYDKYIIEIEFDIYYGTTIKGANGIFQLGILFVKFLFTVEIS